VLVVKDGDFSEMVREIKVYLELVRKSRNLRKKKGTLKERENNNLL